MKSLFLILGILSSISSSAEAPIKCQNDLKFCPSNGLCPNEDARADKFNRESLMRLWFDLKIDGQMLRTLTLATIGTSERVIDIDKSSSKEKIHNVCKDISEDLDSIENTLKALLSVKLKNHELTNNIGATK